MYLDLLLELDIVKLAGLHIPCSLEHQGGADTVQYSHCVETAFHGCNFLLDRGGHSGGRIVDFDAVGHIGIAVTVRVFDGQKGRFCSGV